MTASSPAGKTISWRAESKWKPSILETASSPFIAGTRGSRNVIGTAYEHAERDATPVYCFSFDLLFRSGFVSQSAGSAAAAAKPAATRYASFQVSETAGRCRKEQARRNGGKEQTRKGDGNRQRSYFRGFAKLRHRRKRRRPSSSLLLDKNSGWQPPGSSTGALIPSTVLSLESRRQGMIQKPGDRAGTLTENVSALRSPITASART